MHVASSACVVNRVLEHSIVYVGGSVVCNNVPSLLIRLHIQRIWQSVSIVVVGDQTGAIA